MGGHNQELIVVMVPLPAQGHLNQLLHLSALILSHNIPVHYAGLSAHNRQAKLRSSSTAAAGIQFHNFEIPPFHSPSPNPSSKNKFPSHLLPCFKASSHLRGHVSLLLRSLSTQARKVIVIHDSLMGYVVQEVSSIPNAESYTFHSISAFSIYLFKKHKAKGEGYEDYIIPSLDGCYTEEFLDFVSSQYQYHGFNSGYIYNACRLFEGEYLDSLEKEFSDGRKNAKHWALGPFNPVVLRTSSKRKQPYCLEWLDKQEKGSVIYVSFGTTTTLEDEQINQLAIGLKRSNHKFIWVLRQADQGDLFRDGKYEEDKVINVSKSYEEELREEGKGLIVRDWAPQLEILGHEAVGGFMSHCGWNSCMESISMGVPVAGWPIHSDQPRNAFFLSHVLKVGVMVREWDRREEMVGSEVVEGAIMRLMGSEEGAELRRRAAELGEVVKRSVVEEGGSSRSEFDSFIKHITRC